MSRTRGHGHHTRKDHEWTAPWHRLRHQEPSAWAAYEAEAKLDLGPAWTRESLAVAQAAMEPGRVDVYQMQLLAWVEKARDRRRRGKFCLIGENEMAPETTPDPTRGWLDVTEDDIGGWGS